MDGRALQQSISNKYPMTNPEITEFPSGSFMIDLTIALERYVIEYISGQGFGVSRQSGSGYGWEGVDIYFQDSSLVESYIGELLERRS